MTPKLERCEISLTPGLYESFYNSLQGAGCGICHLGDVMANLCLRCALLDPYVNPVREVEQLVSPSQMAQGCDVSHKGHRAN